MPVIISNNLVRNFPEFACHSRGLHWTGFEWLRAWEGGRYRPLLLVMTVVCFSKFFRWPKVDSLSILRARHFNFRADSKADFVAGCYSGLRMMLTAEEQEQGLQAAGLPAEPSRRAEMGGDMLLRGEWRTKLVRKRQAKNRREQGECSPEDG